MTRLFAAIGMALALAGTVSAQSAPPNGLTGTTICLSVESTGATVLGQDRRLLADRMAFELERQLKQAGVRYERRTDCRNSSAEVFVGTDTSESPSSTGGFVAWIVRVFVLDWTTPHPVSVSVWEDLTFGYSNRTGAELEDYLYDVAREEIEGFANAWNEVNP